LISRRKAVVIVLGAAVILVFALALYRERQVVWRMSQLGGSQLTWIGVTIVVSVLLTGATTRLYLSTLGVYISLWESFWLAAVNFLCSYLPLQANLLIRAKYLKQLHSLDYPSYTAMVLMNLLLMFCAVGIYGLAGLGWIAWTEARFSGELAIMFGACILVPLCVLGCVDRFAQSRWLGVGTAADIVGAARRMRRSTIQLTKAVGLIVAALFVLSLRFYAAAQHVGPVQRIELAMALPPIAAVSTYVAITPNGLGVRELLSSGVASLLGMPPSTGLAVTTVERALTVVGFGLLGVCGTFVLATRLRNQKSQK
jgi:uncharacterized membrane protein YbhN (UPF0104 family)